MMTEALEQLKQRIPLLDYLRQRNWTARRVGPHPEFVGLCPLHPETRPSFYVNARKNLFYCHGCGRGGDLIRLVQLSQGLSFRQSIAYLQRQLSPPPVDSDVLEKTAAFYQFQLHRHPEAVQYPNNGDCAMPALSRNWALATHPVVFCAATWRTTAIASINCSKAASSLPKVATRSAAG